MIETVTYTTGIEQYMSQISGLSFSASYSEGRDLNGIQTGIDDRIEAYANLLAYGAILMRKGQLEKW